jgi:hypothetical protein
MVANKLDLIFYLYTETTAFFKSNLPSVGKLVWDGMFYFELLNDTKAYSNSIIHCEDIQGNMTAKYKSVYFGFY